MKNKKLRPYSLKYRDDPKDRCTYFTHYTYIEVFGWHVHFILSDDITKVRRSKKFSDVLGEDASGGLAYAFAEHRFKKGDLRSFVFLPYEHETYRMCPAGIVAHECMHVVWTIAEETGMKDEETSCYLEQMLVSHADTFIRDVQKYLLTAKANADKILSVAGG
jgi:hypothetical protein